MNARLKTRRLTAAVRRGIRGAGGGGEEKQHKAVESPDNLHSIAYAKIVDLVSEGDIEGFVTVVETGVAADILKDIYLDQTPIANADGTLNFKNVVVDSRLGTQDQDYMKGFPSVENEIALNTALTSVTPFTRAISDLTLDAIRMRLSVNALSESDPATGDIKGYRVNYAIDISTDGGAYVEMINASFDGKTGNVYERSHRIDLPKAVATGWNVRVRRITPDTATVYIQSATNVVSITEIVDVKMRYPNSALVGLQIDASQFQNIPTRSFHLKGRRVKVPANYNPITRVYATTGTGTSGGAWNGTFKVAWTDNPAWVFYDMATHSRYGLGHLVDAALIDKWALYGIAQYCDGYVPTGVPKRAAVTTGSITLSASNADNSYNRTTGSFLVDGFAPGDEVMATGFGATDTGRGVIKTVTALKMVLEPDHDLIDGAAVAGRTITTQDPTEPRMTCNLFLQQQADAYKVLGDLASIFRGICYWSNGSIVPVADRPTDPVYTYTNANVEGGTFRYEGTGRRARHTVALVSWSDPDDFGRAKVEYIEDEEGIKRYGVNQMEVIGIGTTSRWAARRIGRWALLSERLETQTCTWTVGLDGTYAVPGQIVRVADQARAGRRLGGRVKTGSTSTYVLVDAWPSVMPVAGDTLVTTTPAGVSMDRVIASVDVDAHKITPTVAFGAGNIPVEGSIWAVETTTLKLQNYRVLSVVENTEGKGYTIVGLEHNESKFDAVDFGAPVEIPTTSAIPSSVQVAPATVAVSSVERAGTVIAAIGLSATWPATAGAIKYRTQWKKDNANWTPKVDTPTTHVEYPGPVFPGSYYCRVYAVNSIGVVSVGKTSALYTVGDQTLKPTSVTDAANAAAAAQTAANAANADIANMVSDGILSVVEKKRVINDYNVLINDQPGIDAEATNMGITTEKTNYDASLTALTTYLGTVTSPVAWNNLTNYSTVVGATFRAKFADAYAKRQVVLNKIYNKEKTLSDAAQTAANNAQTTANTATADLANIASDNILSVVEKKRVIVDYNSLVNEHAGIQAQAAVYNIGTELDDYNTAYSAWTTYLATCTSPVLWSNLTNYTSVVGGTFRSKFADVYQTRQVLLQKIADVILYGADYVTSENLLPNPNTSSNRINAPINTYRANGQAVCDGWTVSNQGSMSTEACIFFSGTAIRLAIYGATPLANNGVREVKAVSPKIFVQPGKTYELGAQTTAVSLDGTIPAGVNVYSQLAVHWYNSAGSQISYVDGCHSSRTTAYGYGTIVAPATAAYCTVDVRGYVQNLTGASWTHSGTIAFNVGMSNLMMRKLEDLAVAGSGYRLGDQRNSLIVRVGSTGSRWSGAAITYSVPTTGVPATVTINVAAGTLQCGSVGVAYNASSGTVTQTRSTTVTYYLYYQDVDYSGGAKTLNITTNAANLSNADDRAWIGSVDVTTPALGTGGSGSGGGGGGCVDGAMWIDDDRQAEEICAGDLIDIVDERATALPQKARRRVSRNEVRIAPAIRMVSESGAVVVAGVTTPMTLRDGNAKFIGEMLGEEVLVDKGGDVRWERVVECYPIGNRPVCYISVGGGSYFAGVDPNHRIATHNALKP